MFSNLNVTLTKIKNKPKSLLVHYFYIQFKKFITDPGKIWGCLVALSQDPTSKKQQLHKIPLSKIAPFTNFKHMKLVDLITL